MKVSWVALLEVVQHALESAQFTLTPDDLTEEDGAALLASLQSDSIAICEANATGPEHQSILARKCVPSVLAVETINLDW